MGRRGYRAGWGNVGARLQAADQPAADPVTLLLLTYNAESDL